MKRVGVVGATGFAGAELVRLLALHPNVDLAIITSRQFAGRPIDSIYPALENVVDLTCQALDPVQLGQSVDLVFLALPHKIPMAIVPELLECETRVVDLSADFRFSDAAVYEAAYQTHSAPHLLKEAVYGLSEVYRDSIKTARVVGNPGCYPTSILLPLIPLVLKGCIALEGIVADAKSGVSGAGRSLNLGSQYCQVQESFKPYKVACHRHNPEIDEILGRVSNRSVHITFVPHLVPMSRGMNSTIYARLNENLDQAQLTSLLSSFYENHPFVRVLKGDQLPNTLQVRGTNNCQIAVRVDQAARQVILMSAIDNLVKGAAGQAVQNMNLMLGLAETQGLNQTALPV